MHRHPPHRTTMMRMSTVINHSQQRQRWRIPRLFSFLLILILLLIGRADSLTAASTKSTTNKSNIVILGGSGRIGTAVAIHLLQRDPNCSVVLVGRRQPQINAAVQEVVQETASSKARVRGSRLESVWDEFSTEFQSLVDGADCLIHTAGPYLDEQPVPLRMALKSKKCRAYVDVSDPLPYLEQSLLLSDEARKKNLTALVAAGAFPGMSNVLAVEAGKSLGTRIQDVRFNYFTAGLGGSGAINLYITNLGFGEPMVQYDSGELRWFMALSGLLLGKINFFLPPSQRKNNDDVGNRLAKQRVGTQTVFAWPFPEAATVAKHLNIRGNSYAAMGTAPDLWNTMLGILVSVVPRRLWKNQRFSKFMADFSQPLVTASDALLERTGMGETHAMRIDVTSIAGPREAPKGVSIVQAHDSFRRCVGQSCAEFALDLLENKKKPAGVHLPEQYYDDAEDRTRIIKRLTNTPGTFCYTGPVASEKEGGPPEVPSNFYQTIVEANEKEATMLGKNY